MSKSNLFIPQKIKVGYQNRNDTYTGKLAYVIYYDNKGKLRKESSWQSWRDKKIDADEFDNTPIDGFVLNKKVGGYKSDWNFRQAYVRVYDPRGFEFEITVPNLLYILENTSSIKGKGLEGEFVYAWDGADLVLLPAAAPDYIELTTLNEKRFSGKKIGAKDLKIGATYLSDGNTEWVYMGRFDYYEGGYTAGDQWFVSYNKAYEYADKNHIGKLVNTRWSTQWQPTVVYGACGTAGRRHCFYSREQQGFIWPTSIPGKVVDVIVEDPALDYADLFDQLERTVEYSPHNQELDEKYYLSIDEVRSQIGDNWWGSSFYADGVNRLSIRRSRQNGELSNEGYVVEVNGVSDVRQYFPMRQIPNTRYQEMIPVPLEDIYDKFRVYGIKQYLANGKFYRTVYR